MSLILLLCVIALVASLYVWHRGEQSQAAPASVAPAPLTGVAALLQLPQGLGNASVRGLPTVKRR